MLVNSIGVVIPAYNAEKTIGTIIEQLINYGFKPKNIIVVDDGSKDNTYSIAMHYDIELIRNHNNMGKGAALDNGFNKAMSLGLKKVFTLDADGQHQVSDSKTLSLLVKILTLLLARDLKTHQKCPS